MSDYRDYESLKLQAEMRPNSTAAIAIIAMDDERNRIANERREKLRGFFGGLFKRS